MKHNIFSEASSRIFALSNEDILNLVVDTEATKELKFAGKSLYYMYKECIKTTNKNNESYTVSIRGLTSPEILQQESIQEFVLLDNQSLKIHKLLVVRNGEIIDKSEDCVVRVFDDEKDSRFGSIHNSKKVHCTVNDIRLHDSIVVESTLTTDFTDDHYIDKKYFNHNRFLPAGAGYFKQFYFSCTNEREEELTVAKNFFRDEKGVVIAEPHTFLKKGNTFEYSLQSTQVEYKKDEYVPWISISTTTTWKDIARDVYELHEKDGVNDDFVDTKEYAMLNLSNPQESIDDKIQKCIEFVQNDVVYLYDAYVMHRHIPQRTSKTIQDKSGDCKATSQALVDLLKSIGVHADIVWVNYQSDYFLSLCLPSPFVFNHAIVRIKHNESYYFVDPTQSEKYGQLEYRSEPFFSYYLVIEKDSDLKYKDKRKETGLNVEQHTDIVLKKTEGTIHTVSTYRRESADAIRLEFKRNSKEELLQYENNRVFSLLSYTEDKDLKQLFKDTSYIIVSDDKKKNELVVEYKTSIVSPYQTISKYKVFKFYYQINVDPIKQFSFKDAPCDSFFAFPARRTLKITSDLFIARNEKETLKNTKIDNEYFRFENTKKASFRTINVVSEFIPKQSRFIKEADLQKVKDDVSKIAASNYGVGLVYQGAGRFIGLNAYWIFITVAILSRVITDQLSYSSKPNEIKTIDETPTEVTISDPKSYKDSVHPISFVYPPGWELSTYIQSAYSKAILIAAPVVKEKRHLTPSLFIHIFNDSSGGNLSILDEQFKQKKDADTEVILQYRGPVVGNTANVYVTKKLVTYDNGLTYITQKSEVSEFVYKKQVYHIEYNNDIENFELLKPVILQIMKSIVLS
ncbi:MAG: hypothetical protein RL094_749 [Candidatus Parcubacteria bacterium]|jgi:hypothetical protein